MISRNTFSQAESFSPHSCAWILLLCKKSRWDNAFFSFRHDRSPGLDFHHLKFVWLTWPRLIVRSAGPSQDRIGREGGLAKYLITFELTYRYRDNWTFSCRGSLSALCGTFLGYIGHLAIGVIPSLHQDRKPSSNEIYFKSDNNASEWNQFNWLL